MEYSDYYHEALAEPMKWIHLDTDFMRDFKVRRLAVVGGWEYVGKYAALIACLGEAKGHVYDVGDEHGWEFLAADLSCGGGSCPVSDAKAFVRARYDVGLIDRAMWDESGKIASERLMRDVEKAARDVSAARYKAALMRAKKRQ